MQPKMTILRTAVLLMIATACGSRLARTGEREEVRSVAGVYDTDEFLFASACAGAKARTTRLEVQVDQEPRSASIRMKWKDGQYEAKVRKDGSFDSKESAIKLEGTAYGSKIGGHFTDTSFYARINMRRKGLQLCYYQLRWAGVKR